MLSFIFALLVAVRQPGGANFCKDNMLWNFFFYEGQCAMELRSVVFSSFLFQVKSDGDFLKAKKSFH